jgi:hypothetical protein
MPACLCTVPLDYYHSFHKSVAGIERTAHNKALTLILLAHATHLPPQSGRSSTHFLVPHAQTPLRSLSHVFAAAQSSTTSGTCVANLPPRVADPSSVYGIQPLRKAPVPQHIDVCHVDQQTQSLWFSHYPTAARPMSRPLASQSNQRKVAELSRSTPTQAALMESQTRCPSTGSSAAQHVQ